MTSVNPVRRRAQHCTHTFGAGHRGWRRERQVPMLGARLLHVAARNPLVPMEVAVLVMIVVALSYTCWVVAR